mmetsp:Transcript_12903/g.18841  ORF Transcript_12903/g.18841 Transcript_12903/m.18841 type:complete len:153 (-) Transcript_12903:257-715(-)
MTWEAMKNKPTHDIPTNLAMQMVTTDEWRLTAPFANPIESNVNINAGFRPTESKRDPRVGEIIISVRAAHADSIDSVDVARSDPSSAMRAGAGENATTAVARTMRKFDDWNMTKSLLLQDTISSEGGDFSFKLFLRFVTTAALIPPPLSDIA